MKKKLIEYLNNQIKECEGSCEELIQERDNSEEADRLSAKAQAFKEVVAFINTL